MQFLPMFAAAASRTDQLYIPNYSCVLAEYYGNSKLISLYWRSVLLSIAAQEVVVVGRTDRHQEGLAFDGYRNHPCPRHDFGDHLLVQYLSEPCPKYSTNDFRGTRQKGKVSIIQHSKYISQTSQRYAHRLYRLRQVTRQKKNS